MTQKQRSLTLFAVIVGLAAAIGLYGWFGVYQVEDRKQKQKEKDDVLFSFKKDDVQRLSLTSKGQTVEAVHGDKGWTIEKPIKTGGDKFAWDAAVDRLAGLKQKRDIGEVSGSQQGLGTYGLDTPALKAVVTLNDGKTDELDLGNDQAYDNTVYAKRGGDSRVSLLDGAAKYPLEKGLFELRDKRVMPFEDAQLKHLDVATPSFAYGLDRGADGKWKVTAPTAMDADSPKCTQIANALKNLRATRFVTDEASQANLSRYGLDKPGDTVQLQLDNQQKTLVLSSQKEGTTDHVYVKIADEPFIAEVATSILKDLDVKLGDLRDKTILNIAQADIRGFRFQVGGKTFEAQKTSAPDAGVSGEAWQLADVAGSGGSKPAKKWKLTSLSNSLHDLKGASIVTEKATAKELATAGLDHPVKTVSVLGEGGKVLATLLIGKTEQSKASVKTDASPRIYTVESFKVASVPAAPEDLVDTPAVAKDGGATASTAQK